MTARTIADTKHVNDAIHKLADDIRSRSQSPPLLVGIRTNGVPLAARLARELGQAEPTVGAIDITLYRDDLDSRALPVIHGSDIPFDINGRRVVLVDDVLFTGRTVRAALAVLADFGRPERIELCVLVDRGGRELPICPDYKAFEIETDASDHVHVKLTETGAKEDAIEREQKP